MKKPTYSELEGRVAKLTEVLKEIVEHDGMTKLSGCCVMKTCQEVYEDGKKVAVCAFQYGVFLGYEDCVNPAKKALKTEADKL